MNTWMCLSMVAHVKIAGQLFSQFGGYFRDGLTKYRVQEGHRIHSGGSEGRHFKHTGIL